MKWQYLIFKPHHDLEKREFAFNTLGGSGWELVGFDIDGIAHFKRLILDRSLVMETQETVKEMY